MGFYRGPNIVKDGLVLWLDAANPRSYPGSGTAWNDMSGNNNSGSLVNGPTFSSANYGSIAFDGTNDTVSVTKPNPNVAGYISLCTWIKFNTYDPGSSSGPVIIHKGNHYTFQMRSQEGTDYWTYADSSLYNYMTFGFRQVPGLYQTNTWMNLVVTKDSSNTVRLYKNGVLLDTRASFGSTLTQTNSTLFLSGYSDTDTNPTTNLLNGNIGQVQIYNRALSPQEVKQNYDALKGRYSLI